MPAAVAAQNSKQRCRLFPFPTRPTHCCKVQLGFFFSTEQVFDQGGLRNRARRKWTLRVLRPGSKKSYVHASRGKISVCVIFRSYVTSAVPGADFRFRPVRTPARPVRELKKSGQLTFLGKCAEKRSERAETLPRMISCLQPALH
jgi:hypothetical protein